MNTIDHTYNTRSTSLLRHMNTPQRTSLGISTPIKIYNIQKRTLVLNTSDKDSHTQTNKKVTQEKINIKKKKTRSKKRSKKKTKKKIVIKKSNDTHTTDNPFSLYNLIQKMNIASKDYDDENDPDYVPSDDDDDRPKMPKLVVHEVHNSNTILIHKQNKKKYSRYNKKDERLFFNSLNETEKEKYKLLEKSIQDYRKNTIPLRFKILQLDIPIYTKNYIIEKIDQFASLESGDNEYHKLQTWLHNLIKIPFGQYITPTITNESSSEEIANYIKKAQTILNDEVYGHKEAKDQIIEIIASQISNPELQGVAIGIKGPPGNGKTTLIKNGISKALDRPFRLIGLGGSSSSDFLVGHDYTYEGSVPGKIIQVLQESKCMNPIIYFDELDKVSDTTKGEEIINLLCHLVDTSQNTHFSDKYFSGIDIDMSRVLFVFSYNDESKISPILLDRFIKINTNKFNKDDKIIIAKDYLIPSICKNIHFTREHISFTNECVEYIITNHTKGEKGVRNLRRFLEKIITRINILHLLRDYSGNIEDIIPYSLKEFTLPICINKDIADTIVKINVEDQVDPSLFGLYS